MGVRWALLAVLAVAVAPVRPQLEYNITTTWNGEEIDHEPIQLVLSGSEDGEYLELAIEAPFFDDPPAPPGPAGRPFYGLWNYEVVEAFFLNDDNQYVEVEVCPWGQHIVLLLNGQRVTIRHSLPLDVNTSISGDTWSGIARIPVGYLPKNTTKFNAYGIHGSGDNRTYESLYPASANATAPDFHALEYFNDIDLSEILPGQGSAEMSELWSDSIEGIFRYRIQTTWNSLPVDHPPAEITLQGFTAGVEMNVTAPFFNDPAPGGIPGQPFYGLWDYEVVEMFFLNDKDEYLEVELGPWGEHLLLMLKGARNVLKHSLALDYVIIERTEPTGGKPGTWKGSAMLPPDYFPPKVNRINAYAIHGVDDSREYQSLYPAPHDDPDFPVPDFHRLELFQPIDFEFLVTNNSDYSQLWRDAIGSGSTTVSPVDKTEEKVVALNVQPVVEVEEEVGAVTVLGPDNEVFQPTPASVQPLVAPLVKNEVVQAKEEEVSLRKPKPQRVLLDEPREQFLELKPASHTDNAPRPQPVRIGNREIEIPSQRPQHTSSGQGRPLRQHQRPTAQFQNDRVVQEEVPLVNPRPPFQNEDQSLASSQFQPQGQTIGTSLLQSARQPLFPVQHQGQTPNNVIRRQPPKPSPFQLELPFSNQGQQRPFQNQGQPAFPSQEQPPFESQGQPISSNQEQPSFQSQGRPPFQNQGRPPFQSQGQPPFQSQGQPPFQSQGQPPFQSQGRPPFQGQGRPPFQSQGQPAFQSQGQPPFQNQGQPPFQSQGQPLFQSQGQPPFQSQGQPPFQSQGQPPFPSQGQLPFIGQEQPPLQSQGQSPVQNQGLPHITRPQFQDNQNAEHNVEEPPRFQNQDRPSIQFQEDPTSTQTQRFQSENPDSQEGFQSDIPGSETTVNIPSLGVGLEETLTPEVEQAVITLAEETPALPPPHPICFELGLVPDPDRCFVFHECVLEEGQWQMYSWRCRRGQKFDPVNVACVRGRCARRRRVRRP